MLALKIVVQQASEMPIWKFRLWNLEELRLWNLDSGWNFGTYIAPPLLTTIPRDPAQSLWSPWRPPYSRFLKFQSGKGGLESSALNLSRALPGRDKPRIQDSRLWLLNVKLCLCESCPCEHAHTSIVVCPSRTCLFESRCCVLSLRPVRLLRVRVSEGVTQADS